MTETPDQPQTQMAQLQALQDDLKRKLAGVETAGARLRARSAAVNQAVSRVTDPSA